ncbi:MAG: hypothetical protein J6C76_00630 [Oscillospiraceae bacterium]|nr:hypothetical protein [Oscillospiraceae bacterium]
MATTAPDSVSGLIYHNDDKKKKNNKEQQNLQTAATTPAASQKPAASGGGTKASAAPKTTPTVYEDPVTNKNAQKAAERAQKTAAKAPSSLDVSYDTQQTVAQKRQEQKDAQWMGLGNPQGSMAETAKSSTAGTAKSSTDTYKNSADTYTAWYSGKMEVRSPFTPNQWNSTVKTTVERESPAKDTAFARPKTNTSPLWQTAGTASQWGGAKPQNTKDTYPGFERDLDSMWARYGAQLIGEEKKKAAKAAKPAKPARAAGPNAEMAGTVRLAPQYRAPAANTGPGAEMGKAVKPIKKPVSNNIIDLSPPHYMTIFEYIDWINGIGPSKETGRSANRQKSVDLTAEAQEKSFYKNPVLQQTDMINPPDEEYMQSDVYWKNKGVKINAINSLLQYNPLLKLAEIDKILNTPASYFPHISGMLKIRNSEKSAANTRNKVFTEYVGGYDGYGLNIDGGLPNAFLHIYLAAKTTDELGEKAAREFLTAHETFTDKQYEDGFLYKQDDISFDLEGEYQKYEKYAHDKKYPLVKHHVEMDLHNNDIGIQIALSTPENPDEITEQLKNMLWEHETLESLRAMFDGYSDREILFIKKALDAVYSGEAAVIWDFPGNNLPE